MPAKYLYMPAIISLIGELFNKRIYRETYSYMRETHKEMLEATTKFKNAL